MDSQRPVLVTSALPYANGPIHLGHMVEYIQTDIWVRLQRFRGRKAWYFCADDTHGTPVMIAARRQGITPETLVERTHAEHLRDLTGFEVEFDHYYSTHSPENREYSSQIYESAKKAGHIRKSEIEQLFCDKEKMFLPDRFVKGTCPKCGAADQYGDSCEVCSSTYSPKDLINPHCASCGSVPILKKSEHLFFQLGHFQKMLTQWIESPGRVDSSVVAKMKEWLEGDLRDWDISRDAPYFGFEIPGEKDRYFYVWLDAPVGYMASSRSYFVRKGEEDIFDLFWKKGGGDIVHFIGKDIVYFHTLFWPALLEAGGYQKPTAVHVHGFLTLNGEKMSKSRGTLIRAETYLRHVDPQALRYFYASRLSDSPDDIDFTAEDFANRYNSEVVGNFANIFSRLCSGIAGKLDQTLSAGLSKEGKALCKNISGRVEGILDDFSDRRYGRAMREIAAIGDEINRFVNDRAPWKLLKEKPEEARQVMTDALNAGKILAGLLKPVLPGFAGGVEELLALKNTLSEKNLDKPLPARHRIRDYRHLASRIDPVDIAAMMNEEKAIAEAAAVKSGSDGKSAKNDAQKKTGEASSAAKSAAPSGDVPGIITMDDLGRVELRVGKIVKADTVEGADRLLSIQLDLGEGKLRQVFAGIRVAYKPEDLEGMLVVAVGNLAPRKMKFGVSEAMLLAAGEGDGLSLFVPHRTAKPGDRLK